MMNKKLLVLIMAGITIVTSSCSTMFGDNTRKVNINSKPTGASVYFNGQNVGTTPTSVILPNYIYNGADITLKKDGYQPQTVTVQSEFQMVGLWNLLNGFGFLIDAATGNFMKISPDNLNVSSTLSPKTAHLSKHIHAMNGSENATTATKT